MEQYIKIKAHNDEGELLGTIKLSIVLERSTKSTRTIVDFNKEIKLDNSIYNIPSYATLILYNVPLVYEYDNKTPIQFYKNSENYINIMLLEDLRYNLSFKPNYKLDKEFNDLDVFHSLLKFEARVLELFPHSYNGFLSFGSYVGKSYFDIYENNKSVFKIPFEVRSRKIDYATEYASMIGDLSKYSQSLIYESSSPLSQLFDLDNIQDKSSYEEFMLLEYLFKDENLPSTIEYLSRNLYSALIDTKEEVPTSFASNINPNDLIDVFSNSDNLTKTNDADSIWYKQTKGHIPLKINETKYIDNIDVPENRFYKNFLESIETLINQLLKNVTEGYIKDKLHTYKETISAYLSQRYFKDIGMMDYVPLNSQLLQKKEGYRDILQYYLMFELGFKLKWDELTDVFKGNEKKVFELYEYWCYFELADIISNLCDSTIDFNDIFSLSEDKMTISLREGIVKKFNFNIKDENIRIDLLYNKTFSKSKFNDYNSYSVNLRPDYSLIIHIGDERYIIHFDAKYKLNINDESFKNEDVVKMHAYKDAIADTIGAYVLYPGEKKKLYHEEEMRLKSVGAFPLNPGGASENKKELIDFIRDKILDLNGLIN